MKKIMILLCFCLLWLTTVTATNLRGQVVRNAGGSFVPLAQVRVDIMVMSGGQWTVSATAITGSDGFYFFLNFPAGQTFCLSVLGHFYPVNSPLISLPVTAPGFQELPVIST